MDLKNFFNKIKSEITSKGKQEENVSHWVKCPSCESLMFFKEVENLNHVCPKCSFHMRIGATKRIELLADKDNFKEEYERMKRLGKLTNMIVDADNNFIPATIDDVFPVLCKDSSSLFLYDLLSTNSNGSIGCN